MPHDPTPRKLHKLTRFDFGRMQVISINDFERAQEAQLECIMDGAVDNLEALTHPTAGRPTVADVVVQFGQLRLCDEIPLQFRFDFEPPTTCKQWPGPRYGSFSLHKPLPSTKNKGKTKAKGAKTSKKHGQPDDFKQNIRPLKAPKPKKVKKVDVAPVLLSAKTSRVPPLELLGLPAEIRNAIWTLLAVQDDPIEAQLQPIRPCKRPTKLRGAIIRRFPIEPVVARVNRQLRWEVLSIFYGDNRFIFQNNGFSTCEGHRMTEPAIMERWHPSHNIARCLSHLDLRFSATSRSTFKPIAVVYKIRKLVDGKIATDVKLEKTGSKGGPVTTLYCLCREEAVLSATESCNCDGDVTEKARWLTAVRNETIFGHVGKGEVKFHHPEQATCKKCEKATFTTLSSA